MARVLADKKNALGRKLRARFPRGNLSRWSRGHRFPELEALVELENLSPTFKIRGWLQPPKTKKCKSCGSAAE